MVCREVKIERRLFTIKQGKKGTFDVLTFEEHGLNLGSLTLELTSFLSMILHGAADVGTGGKNYWSSTDMMYWLKIHKRSNVFGEVMEVSWARKLRNSGKMLMEIPRGLDSCGWKRFAIVLDSLNPNSTNWGEDLFPSAYFSGKTRAYNDPFNSPYTTTVDALGNLDTMGDWRSSIICKRPVTTISWSDIGSFINKRFNVPTPLELYPIDDRRAIFFIEEQHKFCDIVQSQGVSFNNWTFSFTAWIPLSHKLPSLGNNGIFWIRLLGVPLNFWTPEIIRNLSAHCGEFMAIDPNNLALTEISSIKVKIRNVNGPNSIPRILNLQTPNGDFNVQVHIVSSGEFLSSPAQQRVVINEVEEGELEALVAHNEDVDHSSATISDNWTFKEMSRQRIFRSVSNSSTTVPLPATQRDSYTTLSQTQFRTRRRRRLGRSRQRKQRRHDKQKDLAITNWRWVPKTLSNVLGGKPIQISNSNLNENLQQEAPEDNSNGSPETVVPHLFYIGALLSVPHTVIGSVQVNTPTPIISDAESTVVKDTFKTISNSQALALRRLQVGLDVGMTVSNCAAQALELIERNIRRDEQDAELFNSRHINPDLVLTQEELLVVDDTDQVQEEGNQSNPTPLAPFLDPLDSWSGSFLQDEYSNDSISISIPPGFENAKLPSLRSIKASIKNHHNNKKHLHSSKASVSKCVGR